MAVCRIAKNCPSDAVPYLWNGQGLSAFATSAVNGSSSQPRSDEQELQAHYQRGFREGEAAGKAAKVDAAVEQMAQAVTGLASTRATLFHAAQVDVLRLSIAIARRILHREILMSPDVLGGIISVALDRLEDQEAHTLRIHPSFASRIEDQLVLRDSIKKIQVVADPSLELGGCIFETQQGNMDAGIESQLSEIERGLADHLEAQP